MLGALSAEGAAVSGAALTIAAFETVLGESGAVLVTVGIALFAFSTILGWEYHGEKAFEYLFGTGPVKLYRIFFALIAYFGATLPLEVVWNLSDIFNALMALPNLVCLWMLSGVIAREIRSFQPEVKRRQAQRQARRR